MRKFLRKLFILALVVLVLSTALLAARFLAPISLARDTVEFTIPPGSSLRAAGREIAAAGAGIDPWVLLILARLTGVEASIKAGSYEIRRGITPLELLKKLTRGDFTQAEVTFIEGSTFRQIRQRLDAHPDLRHDTTGLPEAEIMRLLGAPGVAAEGSLFPDTYLFAKRSRQRYRVAGAGSPRAGAASGKRMAGEGGWTSVS